MIITSSGNRIKMIGQIFHGEEAYFEYYFSELEKNNETINIELHTSGGDVFVGNYIEQRLRLSKPKIIISVLGTAFSMGGILLTSADEVEIVSNGWVMLHEAQGTTRGTASAHRTNAEILSGMNDGFVDRLVAKTGKAKKEIQKWFANGDKYFNAKQALKAGIVDRIIDPVIDVEIDESKPVAEREYGRFNALLAQPTSKNKFKSKSIKMKSEIIARYKLQGVDENSSDTAVFEALENHFAKDSKIADYTALKTKYDALLTKQEESVKTQINALLAPFKGKLTDEKIASYEAIGEKAGIEALRTALEGVGNRQSLGSVIKPNAGGEGTLQPKAGWTWDKYQTEDPRGLEALAVNNPDAYLALGKAKFGENFKA